MEETIGQKLKRIYEAGLIGHGFQHYSKELGVVKLETRELVDYVIDLESKAKDREPR